MTNQVVALAEERQQATQAALDEVTAGRTVDHAEVEAWVAGIKVPRRSLKRAGRTIAAGCGIQL